MKNLKNFDGYIQEKFSLMKPKATLPEGSLEVDVTQPIRLFLYKSRDMNKYDRVIYVKILESYIKEYKPSNEVCYDFIMKVEEKNGEKNTLRLDVYDDDLYYATIPATGIHLNYNAETDYIGAETILKLLKNKIEEQDIDKLRYIKLKNIPYIKK